MIIEETIGCITSIKEKVKAEKKIIVVDNKSPNNTGEELKRKYEHDNEVIVLINTINSGFASGNNYGFKYAKDHYNPDFIVVMNNDIELVQDNFEEKLRDEFINSDFDILGPDIYSTTYGIHQSPKRLKGYDYDEIVTLNNYYKKQLSNNILINIKCIFKSIPELRKLIYKIRREKIDYTKEARNVILHGACVIYSRKYIDRYDTAFIEGTFFYYEMEILEYFCRINNLLCVYSPKLKVEHHQNVSTNVAYKSMKDKTIFANKCNYDSTSFFIKYIEQNNG